MLRPNSKHKAANDIHSNRLASLVHRRVVKMSEKRHFNGIRLSPHILNSEAHVDAAVKALQAEIG